MKDFILNVFNLKAFEILGGTIKKFCVKLTEIVCQQEIIHAGRQNLKLQTCHNL
jgi:hypothetical protein